MKTPLVSIITVNLNNKQGLSETLKSVKEQTFKDYEYIVVDGVSTDGSIDVIQQNLPSIHKWVSEKDKGIYDAMNKGISMASGEYCIFINSGDKLTKPTVLEEALTPKHLGADILSFSVLYDYHHRLYEYAPPDKITFGYFFIGGLHHQGTFIRRQLFLDIGLYDTNFKVAADWAFFVTALFKNNASIKVNRLPVTLFNTDGLTSTSIGLEKNQRERDAFLKKEFPLFYDDYKNLNDDLFKYLVRFPLFHKILLLGLRLFLIPAKLVKRCYEMTRTR